MCCATPVSVRSLRSGPTVATVYRSRQLDTRVGSIDLSIPKLREGSYYPGWLLEPRRRAERALVAVVAECYVRGVSTRRVEGLVQTLGIESLSKSQVSRMATDLDAEVAAFRGRPLDAGPYTYVSLDAMTQKVRESGRIVNVAVVIAVGVNAEATARCSASTSSPTKTAPVGSCFCAVWSPAVWPAPRW
jgi:putative transposase